MAWLEIKNLKAFYHAIRVLHGVSLQLERGDFISVIGSNGAGKTTLLRSISRLVSSEGYVRFDGNDLIRLRPRDVIKRGIIHCPEGRLLFPNMTVYQNLMMGAFLQRDRQAIASDLDRVFEYLPLLSIRKAITSIWSGRSIYACGWYQQQFLVQLEVIFFWTILKDFLKMRQVT